MTDKSISQSSGNVKPRMLVYKKGVIAKSGLRPASVSGLTSGRKPGAVITSFSRGSRLRLRQCLVSREVEGADFYALTLTLPGDIWLPDMERVYEAFPETVRRFGVYFLRRFQKSAFVWRVELQERGAPHLHCFAWIHPSDIPFDGFNDFTVKPSPIAGDVLSGSSVWIAGLPFEVNSIWVRAVVQTIDLQCGFDANIWADLLDHGVGSKVIPVKDSSRWMHYCCDHMSKHKQSQLGYRGRQWGLVGKSRTIRLSPVVEHDRRVLLLMQRALGKMRRRRLHVRCVFGWKHGPYKPAFSGVCFSGGDLAQRLDRWARSVVEEEAIEAESPSIGS